MQHTAELYATPCHHATEPTLLSLEVMPPRRPDLVPGFWTTVERLLAAHPDFVSVTYGAGGKDKATASDVVSRLVRSSTVQPIAHLTCVGTTADDTVRAVVNYLDSGVRTFLALRGDPPASQPDWQPPADGVHSATELIHLIRTVERRRCDAHPGEALRSAFKPLTIAVAAFPSGNPATGTTAQQEVERLLVKQAAGANFAITQMFWEPEVYLGFVEQARRAGVTLPIVAGVLPPTDPARLRRCEELSGIPVPQRILDALEAESSVERRHAVGVEIGTRLIQDVYSEGAPGVHLYTFNRAEPSLDILARLGRCADEPSLAAERMSA